MKGVRARANSESAPVYPPAAGRFPARSRSRGGPDRNQLGRAVRISHWEEWSFVHFTRRETRPPAPLRQNSAEPRKVEFRIARPMSRRYFIKTFGCQMNEYDSARMADVLRADADLVATDDPLEADLLLMNTCSVREKAQEKAFSLLGEWRIRKARRPQVRIGVGGCVASPG